MQKDYLDTHGVELELQSEYTNAFYTLRKKPQFMVKFATEVIPEGYRIKYEDYKTSQLDDESKLGT